MYGKSHSEDTRAQMSKSQQLVDRSGENHPMYGRTGANHPMFGKYGITPTNAMTIYVYSLDGTLINSFSSQVAAAEWLNTSRRTLSRYIESGRQSLVWNNQYRFTKSTSSK
jgi:hypothetical protein